MKRVAAVRRAAIGDVRLAALAPVVFVFLAARQLVQMLEDAAWWAGAQRARYSLALLVAVVVLALIADPRYRLRDVRARALGLVAILAVCFACFPPIHEQVGIVRGRLASPHLNDIPLTTMAGARAMAAGQNPYRVPVDPRAESREQGWNYDGLKYMPLMAVVYAPAALAHSERGVILINVCLHVLTALLVFFLARSLAGDIAGSFALLFYLWTRLLPRQLFGPGVTDLAAVAPLLAAFLAGETYPLLSGLLVGIAASTKILPAAALVPLFAPAVNPLRNRTGARFWLGLACGCVPSLVYFAWSPTDFVTNTIVFSLTRPVDSTSWLYEHPILWRHVSTGALFVVIAVAGLIRWLRKPERRARALLVLVVTVALTLLGPVNHTNYQIWWIGWMSVVLACGVSVYLYPIRFRTPTSTRPAASASSAR